MAYNLRKALEQYEALFGEPVEAVVVGKHYRSRWDEETPRADEEVVLGREAGLAKLDQDYDNGYGGADCYPFWAWSASRVFFVAEYDGATSVVWVPRNPVPGKPDFSGCESDA